MPGDRLDRMGFFDRLKSGLTRTTEQIARRFDVLVGQADTPERRSRPIDVDTAEALEELLISADVGVAATERILDRRRQPRAPRRESARTGAVRDPRDLRRRRSHGSAGVAARGAGRRRQRHGQDDDRGQAGQPRQVARAAATHLRRRHVSRGCRRSTADLGRPCRRRDDSDQGGRRSGGCGFRRGRVRQRARLAARCSSIPPAACILAPT